MKYLAILFFTLVVNLSALTPFFCASDAQATSAISIEAEYEKKDDSKSSDFHDEPYFHLIADSSIIPFYKNSYIDESFLYIYEKKFTLLEPPTSTLFF